MNKICGVYLIKSPSNRYYVGQSKDIKRRFLEYKNLKNIGAQPKLHRSFLKYGVDVHIFYLLEICEESFLNCSERYWQEKYDVVSNGLNCVFVECGCERRTGIQKFGEDNPNYGNYWTKEQKVNLSNKKKGIKASDKTKSILSEQRKGGGNSKAKITLDLSTGIFYDCLKESCVDRGLNYHTIKNQVNGTYPNRSSLIYV